MSDAPLLEVTDVSVEFKRRRGRPPLRAVDDVSLSLMPGETVGLVGQSGSGKTTLAAAILGLVPVASGRVVFDGEDITYATQRDRRRLSAKLQVVFQNPYSSLNPARRVGDTLAEPVAVHRKLSGRETAAMVREALETVGLPRDAADRFPTQFSGGQRQRIAIARALMLQPKLVICDEPVTALDLSVQAQTLNLLSELQEQLGLSYLFISHDLPIVRHMAHRILVMDRGCVVEEGTAERVYQSPEHPFTRMLLDAVPAPDPAIQRGRSRAFVAERRAALEAAGASGGSPA